MEVKVNHFIDVPQPGGHDALLWTSGPMPVPGPEQLLIEVYAAGVNLADTKQRMGTYDMPPGAPRVPGLEVSGRVIATGEGNVGFKVGDKVCALVAGGGYAEYCVIPAGQCLRIPKGISMTEAAGLPETIFTVWMALFDQANLAPGETVLVHGGAGGIGTTAIQLARAAGARVLATAGSTQRCQACVDVGAELAINYKSDDFADVIKERLGESSVDVILDTVGAPYIERNLRIARIEGRICYLAGDSGRVINLDLLPVMQKRLKITGGSLRRRPVIEKARLASAIEHRVWPWIESGLIKPKIGMVLPLQQASEAHRALEAREVLGKVILTTKALEG